MQIPQTLITDRPMEADTPKGPQLGGLPRSMDGRGHLLTMDRDS